EAEQPAWITPYVGADQPAVSDQPGELGVHPPPAEAAAGRVDHRDRDRAGSAPHPRQPRRRPPPRGRRGPRPPPPALPPPAAAPFTVASRWPRSVARHRARVGPRLPTGMSRAAAAAA